MSKYKITRYLQSVVAVPLLAVSMPLAGITPMPTISPSAVVLSSNSTATADSTAITTQEDQTDAQHAKILDDYLTAHDSPLAGYGMKFVTEAEKNGIDWRLLVAISGQESTFDKNACKKVTNSFLGYGSCKIDFDSINDAIEKVSASLGGNNAKTSQYYKDKNTHQILRIYNVAKAHYSADVLSIMKDISPDPIS